MSSTLQLAKELISRSSVTPDDAGCQEILIEHLQAMGFQIERLSFAEVTNFWAQLGNSGPLLVFAGHTDVVPTGPLQDWDFPPFSPTEKNGLLYGRGAADMKGSLAAMITACERYLSEEQPRGSIGFLITSDEEGPAINGTTKVMDWLSDRSIDIDYCIVGEPSSSEVLGDTVKVGRRGSLNGTLSIKGIQGHVAYPQLAENPIHKALLPLAELSNETWDSGNDSFPPTTFQISNVASGTGAVNVIPDTLNVAFNFRFSTEVTADLLQRRVESILDKSKLNYTLDWTLSGNPFLTESGRLIDATAQSIKELRGIDTLLSTSGGTSDGRFIAPTGTQVVELGPCNQTIHKVNEHVCIDDLENLSLLYCEIMKKLL